MVDQKGSDIWAAVAQKDSGPRRLGTPTCDCPSRTGLLLADNAASARYSIQGTWLAEHGQGSDTSFMTAMAVVGWFGFLGLVSELTNPRL